MPPSRITLPCGHHANPEQIAALIPDAALQPRIDAILSERARRSAKMRKTHSGGRNGRPRKLVTCPKCGATLGTVAMRSHHC